MNYKKYYAKQLEDAQLYQDFICVELFKKGIVLSNLSSRKYQVEIGENIQGFEIKYDRMFRETNNLYIEFKEKSHPNNLYYVDSGILRHDNTWIYAIGDYNGIYLMQKSVLKVMIGFDVYRKVENKTKTSKGFLLTLEDAEKYFKYIDLSKTKNQKL